MKERSVLIIEDDFLQAQLLQEAVHKKFDPTYQLRVEVIPTEQTFRLRATAFGEKEYNVAIVDVMLRWTDPSPDIEPPPQDVIEGGIMVGGLRCIPTLDALQIPVVVYTVFDQANGFLQSVRPGIPIIQKLGSTERILEVITPYLEAK